MSSALTPADVVYGMEKVKVRVLRPTPELKVGDEVLGPFTQNQEVEVERWIAQVLVEKGYAEMLDSQDVDLTLLSRIAWREERTPQLTQLEDSFYAKVKAYLDKLNEKARTSTEALTEKRMAKVKLIDIVNCRLQKIVNMALMGGQPPKDVLSCLTPEERALLEELSEAIERWRRSVGGVEDG